MVYTVYIFDNSALHNSYIISKWMGGSLVDSNAQSRSPVEIDDQVFEDAATQHDMANERSRSLLNPKLPSDAFVCD